MQKACEMLKSTRLFGQIIYNSIDRKNVMYHTLAKKNGSYAHTVADRPLFSMTIGELLRDKVEKHPDKSFAYFYEPKTNLTYEQFYQKASRLASGLLSLGLDRGDRIGIWGPNSEEWLLTEIAAALAGLILVHVNPAYQSSELAYCVQKVDIKALVMLDKFKTQSYYHLLVNQCHSLPSSKPGCINDDHLPSLRHVIMYGEDIEHNGVWKFDHILDAGDSKSDARLAVIDDLLTADEPASIQFTSGTTGRPKGVLLTYHAMLNNAYTCGLMLGYGEQDHIYCVCPPLFHCFGNVMGPICAITHSDACVFPSAGFDPLKALQAIENYRCTSMYGTPTMYIDVVNHKQFANFDVSSLKTGAIAGSACPIVLCETLVDKMNMKDFTILYGSTETAPVSLATHRENAVKERMKAVGYPIEHVEAKVIDSDGRIVPFGIKGELCTRGYNTFLGYWKDVEKTEECLTPDRWYRTGDLAIMDSTGQVQIVGRAKDMIIRGGENIYPVEIEQIMYEHEHIEEVQIIGVPDDRMGEEVCAWIRLHQMAPSDLNADDIKMWCKGKMAHFKIPKYICFKQEKDFPLTLSGKIQKHRMREIAVEELRLL